MRSVMFVFYNPVLYKTAVTIQVNPSQTYLYALRVHLFPFLAPTNSRLGVARRLTDEGDHTPGDTDLVNGNFSEPWWCWGGKTNESESRKKIIRTGHKTNAAPLVLTQLL